MKGTWEEVQEKLRVVRGCLGEGLALRLRGIDWFAWLTAGGSNAVLLAAETGIAEVVVTSGDAWVVTDEIEARRLSDEELPPGLEVRATAWACPQARETLSGQLIRGCTVISDRPAAGEKSLPDRLLSAKRILVPAEMERYRKVGRLAAEAMTEALQACRPDWSEEALAAAGAGALISRGLAPALVMAAGKRRMQLYRHPMPSSETLGGLAMLVFCARGCGLYANLTRFVSFSGIPAEILERHRQVREVEAKVLELSRPGADLGSLYLALIQSYLTAGHPQAIREHHQGGTTGYLSREVLATPGSAERIAIGTPLAWNPSLAGAKIEDTFLVTGSGLENLTLDPAWPTVVVAGRKRPLVMEQ